MPLPTRLTVLMPTVLALIGAVPGLVAVESVPTSEPPVIPTSGADSATAATTSVANGSADTIVVEGRGDSMVGIAASASQGVIGAEQLANRPLLRPAEVLETVPGMIATQHSGTGKANQYFLRGFNLDHGTDFATSVDGVPVNKPTNAHGQGYTDLNFVIPELVDTVTYRKGVYYADQGDFSSAGGADIRYADDLGRGTLLGSIGTHDYQRALAAASPRLGDGHVLIAGEAEHDDGAWDHGDDYTKLNGVVRYAVGDRYNGWSITGMAYHAEWDSTDQIPARAVDQGIIDRLGSLDTTDGGESARYVLSGEWRVGDENASTTVSMYAERYELDLWSNFTFFLDDPVDGDQFHQADRRWVVGGAVVQRWKADIGVPTENRVGLQTRNDFIPRVELSHTAARDELGTVREDDVTENAVGVFADSTIRATPWLRVVPGLRADFYRFDIDSDNELNSGTETDGIVSPKLALTFGPWADTEFYVDAGIGFHSNDARGTTITVDPSSGDPAEKVDPLVRSEGAEVGARTTAVPGLQSTLGVWILDLDSELLFVGDAGATEASRPSRRVGVESANFWAPLTMLAFDLDYAYTWARFRDDDAAGDRIPGAPESVLAAGVTWGLPTGPFAALRLRCFGPRPLIEDDSVRSHSTTLINASAGWRGPAWSAVVEVLNLLDSKDHDIDYFYASRLQGEPGGGVDDVHYHPVEPITVRGSLAWHF